MGELEKCRRLTHQITSADHCTFPVVFFPPPTTSRRSRGLVPRLREILNLLNRIKLIVPDGQITSDFPKPCQAPKSKIFRFAVDPNQMHILSRPGPQRGVSRSSRTLGRGCGGRGGVRRATASRTNDAEAYGEVVSFWRPNAGVKSALRSAGDGVKQAWSPGRARNKP